MRKIQKLLESSGHTVLVPKSLALIEKEGFQKPVTVNERIAAEEKYHFLSEHFKKVESSDAILVVNPTKNGIDGYIGGNTFLEMGVGYYLGKKIFLLHPIPKMEYELELAAMRPTVLLGDLTGISG